MKSQPVYSDEFKRDAVALVLGGMSQVQVVRDLGVSKSTLSKWVNAVDPLRGHTPVSERRAGVHANPDLVAAKKRIRELEEENYILRRASAYLAQQQKSPK